MNKLDAKVSKHAKDIIQKYTSGLFRNATLEFYGIKTAPIKELISVDLPVVEVSESSADFIFLLEDNTYLHFEFQTTYNKSDLIRFAAYDLRLYERDGRGISTVVIYTADVKEARTELNIGSLTYNPDKILMGQYDGNAIYDELDGKIKAGMDLSDTDMLNLIFLPLMKNSIARDELAVKSVELAQTIPDKTKRNTCIAAAFAFANRYLNEDNLDKLLGVLKMTDLATMLVEEKAIEIAENALKEGLTLETIKKITGLSEPAIKQLQAELNK